MYAPTAHINMYPWHPTLHTTLLSDPQERRLPHKVLPSKEKDGMQRFSKPDIHWFAIYYRQYIIVYKGERL